MGRYLVEVYIPKGAGDVVDEWISSARPGVVGTDGDDAAVRFLRSIYVPEDETWFLLYDAPSIVAVERAVERAELSCARIVEAVAEP